MAGYATVAGSSRPLRHDVTVAVTKPGPQGLVKRTGFGSRSFWLLPQETLSEHDRETDGDADPWYGLLPTCGCTRRGWAPIRDAVLKRETGSPLFGPGCLFPAGVQLPLRVDGGWAIRWNWRWGLSKGRDGVRNGRTSAQVHGFRGR